MYFTGSLLHIVGVLNVIEVLHTRGPTASTQKTALGLSCVSFTARANLTCGISVEG